jgi:hypothetical protein
LNGTRGVIVLFLVTWLGFTSVKSYVVDLECQRDAADRVSCKAEKAYLFGSFRVPKFEADDIEDIAFNSERYSDELGRETQLSTIYLIDGAGQRYTVIDSFAGNYRNSYVEIEQFLESDANRLQVQFGSSWSLLFYWLLAIFVIGVFGFAKARDDCVAGKKLVFDRSDRVFSYYIYQNIEANQYDLSQIPFSNVVNVEAVETQRKADSPTESHLKLAVQSEALREIDIKTDNADRCAEAIARFLENDNRLDA